MTCRRFLHKMGATDPFGDEDSFLELPDEVLDPLGHDSSHEADIVLALGDAQLPQGQQRQLLDGAVLVHVQLNDDGLHILMVTSVTVSSSFIMGSSFLCLAMNLFTRTSLSGCCGEHTRLCCLEALSRLLSFS